MISISGSGSGSGYRSISSRQNRRSLRNVGVPMPAGRSAVLATRRQLLTRLRSARRPPAAADSSCAYPPRAARARTEHAHAMQLLARRVTPWPGRRAPHIYVYMYTCTRARAHAPTAHVVDAVVAAAVHHGDSGRGGGGSDGGGDGGGGSGSSCLCACVNRAPCVVTRGRTADETCCAALQARTRAPWPPQRRFSPPPCVSRCDRSRRAASAGAPRSRVRLRPRLRPRLRCREGARRPPSDRDCESSRRRRLWSP